jgi:hypothetical protein
MQEFIKWGGWSPEELKARQERELIESRLSRILAEARLSNLPAGAVATNSGKTQVSTIQFLVQAYNQGTNLEFTFNVEASSSTTATINWGNGVVNDNLLVDLGMTTFSNVYAQDGDYTVSVTFADPSVITELDFPGMD